MLVVQLVLVASQSYMSECLSARDHRVFILLKRQTSAGRPMKRTKRDSSSAGNQQVQGPFP